MKILIAVLEGILATLIIVVLAVVIGIGSAIYTHKKDNPIEEACESIIETELHLPPGSIELSPEDSKPDAPKTTP